MGDNKFSLSRSKILGATVIITHSMNRWSVVTAKGCADLEKVPDADIKRTDFTAVVKCKNSLETWHLVCRDNSWIGDVRNCSRSSSTERK